MPINVRKSKNLGKGFRATASKSGAGLSFGIKGARVSVNKNGVRGSVGIPGTGVSYSKTKSFPKSGPLKSIAKIVSALGLVILVLYFLYTMFIL